MARHGKRFRDAVKARAEETVSLHDAVTFVRKHAGAKFDETIELHVHLGVDPKQSDQSVRGTMRLPHGAPKAVRVAVFADDTAQQTAAKEAGAHIVGGVELIEQVAADGHLAADVAVTTPDMMKGLAKIAKVLGPKGLMPNPKSGTIGSDTAAIVRELKGGKTQFRMDDSGNVHVAVAKASWPEDRIEGNLRTALEAIRQARPASAKGEYLVSVTVSSTMGPGVSVRV